jgi:hypothetical protein
MNLAVKPDFTDPELFGFRSFDFFKAASNPNGLAAFP